MQKNSFPYRILVINSDVQEVNLISKLIHDRFFSPRIITANFENVSGILSSNKFDVILININYVEDIKLIGSVEKKTGRTALIIISDIMTFPDITDMKITDGNNNVFDYLPKSELSSLLLFKSIVYITEKNKCDIKYNSLKRKYNNLFEMNPVPMWIYDLETLKFWRVNEAAVRSYGHTKEEFMKMTIKDIRPKEDVVKLEKAIDLIRKHKTLFSNGIFRHKKKDGTIIYAEIVSNIIYIDKIKYSLVVANEITETLNYIEAIESQNSKLQEIAFSHSHVIRAPLTNIMGILNLIKEMDLSNPESAELLEHLFTSCNQLDDLADETDTHESNTISEWIIASEDNQKTFDHSKIVWDGAKNQQKVDVDAAWKKLNIEKKKEVELVDNQDVKQIVKLSWVSNFLKIAAVLVVLFGLWFVAAKQFTTPQNDVLTFKSGNKSIEKVLPDGTKILLSKNSEITYPKAFEGDTREINLSGEGFFDVHHDAAHPFIIHTQGTDVKVLGTSFNVRAYNAQVQVLVKTGKVQFSKNKNQVILTKGQKGEILSNVNTIIKSEIAEVGTVTKEKLSSFVFNKMSLGEVVDTLSKQFGKDIKFNQDNIKNCKLTATFENENLENIIAVISETFNLKVDNQVEMILLSGEGCE